MEDGNASSPDLDRSGDIGDKYSLSINPEYWIKLRKRRVSVRKEGREGKGGRKSFCFHSIDFHIEHECQVRRGRSKRLENCTDSPHIL